MLMVMPYQNAITYRIRSTFEGTKDASAAIRDYDRHEVQPYIQAHPMGGGIFTSGGEGNKYNKGHYLEYLQADSGYLKTLGGAGPYRPGTTSDILFHHYEARLLQVFQGQGSGDTYLLYRFARYDVYLAGCSIRADGYFAIPGCALFLRYPGYFYQTG